MSDSNPDNKRSLFIVIVGLATIIAAVIGFFAFYRDIISGSVDEKSRATENAILAKQLRIQEEIATIEYKAGQSNDNTQATQAAKEIGQLNQTKEVLQATLANMTTKTPEESIEAQVASPSPNVSATSAFTSTLPAIVNITPTADPSKKKSPSGEIIVLSNTDDNTYNWVEGGPYITTKYVYEGDCAFIPTGNNHFSEQLGTIGYESNEVRYINLKLYLLKPQAALLLQVNLDGAWEHRWGFDGRPEFSGYGWERLGQQVNLPVGKWIDVRLDLIDQLGGKPGQKVTGLAMSGNDGNIVYDLITLSSSQ